MRIVNESGDVCSAARRLGVTPQSVKARLDRIRLRPAAAVGGKKRRIELTDKQLEQAWSDALGEGREAMANDLFAEMCVRLERRIARRTL